MNQIVQKIMGDRTKSNFGVKKIRNRNATKNSKPGLKPNFEDKLMKMMRRAFLKPLDNFSTAFK